MEKAAKTHRFGTVLAGAIVLLLTALIILGAIFVPRMRENRLFSARYQMLQSAEYTVFLLSDPLYETGGAVATRGAEVVLSAEEVLAIRASLATLREGGFQNGGVHLFIEGYRLSIYVAPVSSSCRGVNFRRVVKAHPK